MNKAIKKINDFYSLKPDAEIYQKEFGFYVLDKWIEEGYLKKREEVEDYDEYLRKVFYYDEPAIFELWGLGWTEAAFEPEFEVKILEDRGEHELVQDNAGRGVLYFKGRRQGFMPEYVDHPVKSVKDWEEKVKWRLDYQNEARIQKLEENIKDGLQAVKEGKHITQHCIGGYMYLRSLIGPENLLYTFYDDPQLIHECMRTWLKLADAVTAAYQKHFSIDELFLGEDICYNTSSLISPDMIREFLFPYYQQLISNMKKRNKKNIILQIDTDGYCNCVIDIYREIGMNYISPLEVASSCDVVEIASKYPDLLLSGGIDKRILAKDKDAIARHVDRIMSFMKKRGGYIPTCDHGVPEEVSFENYMYYRQLMKQY